MKIGSFFFSPF